MRFFVSLLICLVVSSCLIGCERSELETDYTNKNVLIIKPAQPIKADGVIMTKDGDIVYPIGSVFHGGGIADPNKGVSHRCHFYQEKFSEGPDWHEVEAIVEIRGFLYKGVDYNEPGQFIDKIKINGLNESLGFGAVIDIPMEQGKYMGGNDLIKDVQIAAYKFSSYDNKNNCYNKDSNISIVISSVAGDIVTIRFANDVTPYDGYY